MAEFNPQQPDTQDPQFWHWSKAAEQPKSVAPNLSTSVAIKGATSLASDAIQAADTIEKRYLHDTIDADVDKMRTDYSQQLAKRDPLSPKQTTASLMSSTAPATVPASLKSVPQDLDTLVEARNNGKLTQTAYLMKLDAYLKQKRNENPGYKGYVDSEMERATGFNPANRLVQSMQQDIDTIQAQRKEARNALGRDILQHAGEIPEGVALYQKVMSGEVDERKAGAILQKALAADYAHKARMYQFAEEEHDAKGDAAAATHELGKTASDLMNTRLDTLHLVGQQDGQKAIDTINDFAAGKIKLSDQQMERNGAVMEMNYATLRADLYKKAHTTPDKNGRTLADRMTEEQLDKTIDGALKPFRAYADAVTKGDVALMHTNKRMIEASSSDAAVALQGNSMNANHWIQMLSAVSKQAGPQVAGEFLTKILGLNGIPEMDKTALLQYDAALKSQGAGIYQDDATQKPVINQPYTFNDVLKDSKAPEKSAVFNKQIVDFASTIGDPKQPIDHRINLAKAAFSPENQNFTLKFDRDGIDPATGKTKPGQFTVFQTFTSRGNAHEVNKMAKMAPELVPLMQQWTTTEMNALLQNELHDIPSLQDMPGGTLSWDSDRSQLKLDYTSPLGNTFGHRASMNQAERIQVRNAQATIDRLNKGFTGVRNVYEETGGTDVDTQILRMLLQLNPQIHEMPGMPGDITRAIIASRQQQQEQEERKKKAFETQ